MVVRGVETGGLVLIGATDGGGYTPRRRCFVTTVALPTFPGGGGGADTPNTSGKEIHGGVSQGGRRHDGACPLRVGGGSCYVSNGDSDDASPVSRQRWWE